MSGLPYDLVTEHRARLGLIVLQTDEQIETDFRALLPPQAGFYTSRVPSAPEVSRDSLQAMEAHLSAAAALLPDAQQFDAVGYGCTSGTAQIGPDQIAARVRAGVPTQAVTEPVSALIAACRYLGLRRLAILSPYIEPVSAQLRHVLDGAGIATPVFASFDEAEESRVARIAPHSIIAASNAVMAGADVDGLFLSCTNLRAVEVIPTLQAELGVPVLSSNLVLAWHMCTLARLPNTILQDQNAPQSAA